MSAPLTPPDCDLQDSKYMPMYVHQLLNSSFNAMLDDTAWRAGVTLWMKSWHQLPAASLPDDDEELCGIAGFGRDLKAWRKNRAKALRGWSVCDDGRLYHPVLAEAALEAWVGMLMSRISSGAGNAKRYGTDFDGSDIEAQIIIAYAMLKALNPRAEAVKKIDRRNAKDKKPHSQTRPDDLPVGGRSEVPVGSQPEPKPEPEPEVIEEGGGGSARDDLGWPLSRGEWVDILAAETECGDVHRDLWLRRTSQVLVGWHETDRFIWDDVVAGVKAGMVGKANDPPSSWKYFSQPIARAKRDRETPTPEAQPNERRNPDNRDQSAGRPTDYMLEAIASDTERRLRKSG